jgi:glycerol-3-phosphate cytidylyltransferase
VEKIIGYTTGVFDLFHIGHLNLLKAAKSSCDYLIVGVTIDELVAYKGISSFIPFDERIKIVESLKFVDEAVPQYNMNKMEAWEKYKFHKMFVGSDWKGSEKWIQMEKEFRGLGVEIVYFPYTQSTSSTKLRSLIDKNLKNT